MKKPIPSYSDKVTDKKILIKYEGLSLLNCLQINLIYDTILDMGVSYVICVKEAALEKP